MTSLTQLVIREAVIDNLDPGLLTFLPQLATLEISDSSLTHLFPLCSVRSLRTLNITGNHLISLDDSGLRCSEGFISQLQSLDISRNFLTEIPIWFDRALPNLEHVDVSSNQIFITEESPFENLIRLAYLDLRNNSFTSFQDRFLRGSSNLHFLALSGNDIPVLSPGLLANLSRLRHLEISDMGLDDKVWMEISELRQLIHLNMSTNALTYINTEIMGQFLRLETCFLDHNRISVLPKAAFEYQLKLSALDLSFNDIPDVPSDAFINQYALKHLYLQHNKIASISYDSLYFLKELLTLDLSQNKVLFFPPKVLIALTKVTHFDASKNNLTYIDSDLFSKTLMISFLNMSHNSLTEIISFNQLTELETIDISYNKLSFINPSFLLDLHHLTTVIISNNEIKSLPIKLFKGCENIRNINISYNLIKLIDEATFSSVSRIQVLDLSHNEITDINTAFSGLKDLQVLDLSYNNIEKVMRGQFPHFIKNLNLRGNRIVSITVHTFKSLNRIQNVDLSENNLTSLSRMEVEIAFNLGYIPTFNLQSNPFMCDCRLGWLKDLSQGKLKDMMTLPDFNLNSGFKCSSPFYNSQQSLQQLSRAEFLCSYTSHCEESCMCCDYACYCKYVCPASCRCFISDDYFPVHLVLCNSASLTTVPAELPEGATDLRLDGNNIPVLHRHVFLALKHVQCLYLNNSHIHAIENNTFKGLKSVRHLYLNNNRLAVIHSVTFQGLDSLEQLFLQKNSIYSFDFQALASPRSLAVVNLQGNALTSAPLDELWRLANTTSPGMKLYFSENPWSCDPDFICKFIYFFQSNSEFVSDVSYIECVHSEIMDKQHHLRSNSFNIVNIQSQFCGVNQSEHENMTSQSSESSAPNNEMYALIAACIIIAFTATLLVVAYINRRLLQVLFFTRFGFRIFGATESSDDNEKLYDAFISYSNKDEEFVVRQLAHRLENGDKKYAICVHYRDFPAGACIIETIVQSVEASKRTILVVSDNFLDSEWCRFEFQTAYQQVFSEPQSNVIVIVLHSLDPEKMDETLKVYMKTWTCLKYDDPWFWEKLMYAMPDIPHKKCAMTTRLPGSRDLECMAQERCLPERHQPHHHQQHQHHHFQSPYGGVQCDILHNYMYEIPGLDSPSVHYHLAHNVCCSTHTNSAYHNSDSSDCTLGYRSGPGRGVCYHYEEVGPGSSSAHSTPQKYLGTPPPVPSIPKEGFVPRQKLMTLKV